MKTNKKSNIQNIKKIFILNYKTSLEGLNSSLAQSAGELCPVVKNTHGYIFLWDLNFYPIFYFWAIILAPDMLCGQSNPLKTRMIA